MPKLMLLFTFALTTIAGKCTYGQTNRPSHPKEDLSINRSLLMGKWRSQKDSGYKLLFGKTKVAAFYGTDTAENMKYVLSGSCLLKDSAEKVKKTKAFLLFYAGSKVEQCNEILNLEKKTFTWMNLDNGNIFIFQKIDITSK